jgi:hypothetical protein
MNNWILYLKKILDPLGMDYSVSGEVILIDKKTVAPASETKSQKAAPIKVSGKVVDNAGRH